MASRKHSDSKPGNDNKAPHTEHPGITLARNAAQQVPVADLLKHLAGSLTSVRVALEVTAQRLREQGTPNVAASVSQAMVLAEVSRNMVMDAHNEFLGEIPRTRASKRDNETIAQLVEQHLQKQYGNIPGKGRWTKRKQARAMAMAAWRAIEAVNEFVEIKNADEYAYWIVFELRGWLEKFAKFHTIAPVGTPAVISSILDHAPTDKKWGIAQSKVAVLVASRTLPPSQTTAVEAARTVVEALGIDAKTANNWFSVDL